MVDSHRSLSDDDRQRIVEDLAKKLVEDEALGFVAKLADASAKAMRKQVMGDLYTDLGKGLWQLFVRGLLTAVVAVAAMGAAKGIGIKLPWN